MAKWHFGLYSKHHSIIVKVMQSDAMLVWFTVWFLGGSKRLHWCMSAMWLEVVGNLERTYDMMLLEAGIVGKYST